MQEITVKFNICYGSFSKKMGSSSEDTRQSGSLSYISWQSANPQILELGFGRTEIRSGYEKEIQKVEEVFFEKGKLITEIGNKWTTNDQVSEYTQKKENKT